MTTDTEEAFKHGFLKGVIRAIVFSMCLALCAGLMWLGGINWGDRNPFIAIVAAASVWASGIATALFTGYFG